MSTPETNPALPATVADAARLLGTAIGQVQRVIVGQEHMVQQLMVMKQASRSVSRVEHEKGLLDGQMISTSDLDFVINDVRVPL